MKKIIDNKNNILFTLLAVSFMIVFTCVSNDDYKQAVKAEEFYCNQVKSGAWPNYDKSIKCPASAKQVAR